MGKPAGLACVHLDEQFKCRIFGKPERPDVCEQFQASNEWCGETREDALTRLTWLEQNTSVSSGDA